MKNSNYCSYQIDKIFSADLKSIKILVIFRRERFPKYVKRRVACTVENLSNIYIKKRELLSKFKNFKFALELNLK